MVSVGAIKNHLITFPSLRLFSSTEQKVHWKAIAIITLVGLLFSMSLYLLRSRIPFIKKPPSEQTTIASSTDNETTTTDHQPVLQGRAICKAKCLKKIEVMLEPGQKLGNAIDTGDCFYDALSQALGTIDIKVTAEHLREDVAQFLEDSKHAKIVQERIRKDPRGIESFENYRKYVRYSKQQLDELRKTDPEAPEDPYWGDPGREGLILCGKYRFNLRILSAGLIESEVDSDPVLQVYRQEKIEDEENLSFQYYEGLIQERLAKRYQEDSVYFTSDDLYPSTVRFPKTCALALYENHFRPVL